MSVRGDPVAACNNSAVPTLNFHLSVFSAPQNLNISSLHECSSSKLLLQCPFPHRWSVMALNNVDATFISSLRSSSRHLVREFGFMAPHLANTELSPSAVHALIEIGDYGISSASGLCTILNLEKSSVSRMLRKLVELDLLKESLSARDGREKILSLTEKGRETLKGIKEYADAQVVDALRGFELDEREKVLFGIKVYADALRASRLGIGRSVENGSIEKSREVRIQTGYRPGIVARSVEMHINYYSRYHNFGRLFETDLSVGLGELMRRIDDPGVGAWSAVDPSGRIVGTIFVDVLHETDQADGHHVESEEKDMVAHLRMFIVDEGLQGNGVGRKLLAQAMEFVDDVGHVETKLWTFRGLESAKRLYEKFGFVMVEEELGGRWGEPVYVQLWTRKKAAGSWADRNRKAYQ